MDGLLLSVQQRELPLGQQNRKQLPSISTVLLMTFQHKGLKSFTTLDNSIFV